MAQVSEELRHQMIAKAAYLRAEQRGFNGGDPIADWLEAEAEVDAGLDDSVDGFEAKLATVTQKLQAIKKKLADTAIEAREEWDADIEKLAKLRQRFQKRVAEIREQGEAATVKVKQQAEEIWDEISGLIERLGQHEPHSP